MKRVVDACLLTIGLCLAAAGLASPAFATGACCYFGACTELSEQECTLIPGAEFQGEGTTCDPNPCGGGQTSGACCKHDGTCEVLTQLACAIQNGFYTGAPDCDPDPCPALADGACCIAGECTVTSLANCGGFWFGPSVPCVQGICAEIPSGACCLANETCEVMDAGTCLAQGGLPLDEGSTCDPNPCPDEVGACCLQNATCEIDYPTTCLAEGGVPLGVGTSCDPNPCATLFGACCLRNGSCQVMSALACYTNNGWFEGQDTCDPDPCAGLSGACCIASECTVTGIAACAGIWLGPNSTCDPNPCQVVVYGACCVPGVGCELRTSDQCTELSGNYLGDDTTCDPDPCPSPVHESTWGQIKARFRH